MSKIQIMSDLHLEHGEAPPPIVRAAPILALCGDIGHPGTEAYASFLQKAAAKFDHVLVVAGNHEYYAQGSMAEIDAALEKLCTGNVHYLNNTTIDIGDVTFAGTTLWSNIPEQLWPYITKVVNDYRNINIGSRRLTPADTNAMHSDNVAWLKSVKLENAQRKLVVLSHHLPTMANIAPKWAGHTINYAFATELTELLTAPVTLWTHGHSHHAMDNTVAGVRVVSNPRGYPTEKSGFRPDFAIEI